MGLARYVATAATGDLDRTLRLADSLVGQPQRDRVGGALALGGLLVAHRVCASAQYDLVSGLGWVPRVLVDGGAGRGFADASISRQAVRSLPGLLSVDVGLRGGVKVFGGRVESVGEEPVVLLGADAAGNVLRLPLAAKAPEVAGRLCPMCHKVHQAERVELAA